MKFRLEIDIDVLGEDAHGKMMLGQCLENTVAELSETPGLTPGRDAPIFDDKGRRCGWWRITQ